MLDIGWPELLVIGALALIVVGPKDLAGMLRKLGQWTGQLRGMAREFQRSMNEAALAVFRKGHVPIIGVNLALPLIEIAGEGSFEEIMMPLSLHAAERCDAVLRIGGPSVGADQEVERVQNAGGIVYHAVSEVPEIA